MSFLLTNLKEALSPRRPGFGGKVWRTVWAHGLRHFMCYTIVLSAFQNGLTKRISTAPNLRGRRCSCGVALWESRHISSLTMSDHLGIMHLDALRILGIQRFSLHVHPWKGHHPEKEHSTSSNHLFSGDVFVVRGWNFALKDVLTIWWTNHEHALRELIIPIRMGWLIDTVLQQKLVDIYSKCVSSNVWMLCDISVRDPFVKGLWWQSSISASYHI